jgi:hypothetical protein
MDTKYLPPHPDYEQKPDEMPEMVSARYDEDDITDLVTEFATYFTVIAANPDGWRRGEPNYVRTEHLTLEAARKAARTRYENDPKKRGMLIYACLQYSNRPIGTHAHVEGFPQESNPYSREARRAKRKPSRLQKSLRNMIASDLLPKTERHFEPTPERLEEIKKQLEAVNVVGKGGSKVAMKYKNRRNGGR